MGGGVWDKKKREEKQDEWIDFIKKSTQNVRQSLGHFERGRRRMEGAFRAEKFK